jgi:hypothetical protein
VEGTVGHGRFFRFRSSGVGAPLQTAIQLIDISWELLVREGIRFSYSVNSSYDSLWNLSWRRYMWAADEIKVLEKRNSHGGKR